MRFDHLDIYEKSASAVQPPFFNPWRLGPLPPERIQDIIRKPINRARLEVTDELVESLKRDTPTAEALPLLAFTLEKLYRLCASHGKLELQDYVSLGGMDHVPQRTGFLKIERQRFIADNINPCFQERLRYFATGTCVRLGVTTETKSIRSPDGSRLSSAAMMR